MKKIVSFNSFVNESKLQEDYREFFSKMLDIYGVKSPSEFEKSKDTAEKFYDDIRKGWAKGHGITEYGKKLIDDFEKGEKIEESKDDEEIYLTPKQRKLPEGLKKGIIKKMKKSGKKVDDKDCKECDDKEKTVKESYDDIEKSGREYQIMYIGDNINDVDDDLVEKIYNLVCKTKDDNVDEVERQSKEYQIVCVLDSLEHLDDRDIKKIYNLIKK